MSFCVIGSSKVRPMRRLIAKNVRSGLVTAWRLAGWPTRRSPSSVIATIDGVVRAPSEFSMTLGVEPSMTATQLFVVPRSMPMILLIVIGLRASGWVFGWLVRWGLAAFESTGVRRLRHRDERRAQHAVVDQVAFLEHGHHGVRRLVALFDPHRFVAMRVEFLADR